MTGFPSLLGSLDTRACPFIVNHSVGFSHEAKHLGYVGGCGERCRVE